MAGLKKILPGFDVLENSPTWLPVVALAMQRGDGRWLMHRRPDEKDHGGLWEFPGGKVDASETPAAALVREITEELGIAIRECDLEPVSFAQGPAFRGDRQIVILLYKCSLWQGEPRALEGGTIAWSTLDEAKAMPKPPLDHILLDALRRWTGV